MHYSFYKKIDTLKKVVFLFILFFLLPLITFSQSNYQLGKKNCQDGMRPIRNQTSNFNADNWRIYTPEKNFMQYYQGASFNLKWQEYNWNTDMYQVKFYTISPNYIVNGSLSTDQVGSIVAGNSSLDDQIAVECSEIYDKDSPGGWGIWDKPSTEYKTRIGCDWTGALLVTVSPFRRHTWGRIFSFLGWKAWKTQALPLFRIVQIAKFPRPDDIVRTVCENTPTTIKVPNNISPEFEVVWYKKNGTNLEEFFVGEQYTATYALSGSPYQYYIRYRLKDRYCDPDLIDGLNVPNSAVLATVTVTVKPVTKNQVKPTQEELQICGTGVHDVTLGQANSSAHNKYNINWYDANGSFLNEGTTLLNYNFSSVGDYTFYITFDDNADECDIESDKTPVLVHVRNNSYDKPAPQIFSVCVSTFPYTGTIEINRPYPNLRIHWRNESGVDVTPPYPNDNQMVVAFYQPGIVNYWVSYSDSYGCADRTDSSLISIIGVGVNVNNPPPTTYVITDYNGECISNVNKYELAGNVTYSLPTSSSLVTIYSPTNSNDPWAPTGFYHQEGSQYFVCPADMGSECSIIYTKNFYNDFRVKQNTLGGLDTHLQCDYTLSRVAKHKPIPNPASVKDCFASRPSSGIEEEDSIVLESPTTKMDNNKSALKDNFIIKVYPNPVNQTLMVDYIINDVNNYQIVLTDLLGYEVYKNILIGNNLNTLSIDVSNISSGTYICSIVANQNEKISSKLIQVIH